MRRSEFRADVFRGLLGVMFGRVLGSELVFGGMSTRLIQCA